MHIDRKLNLVIPLERESGVCPHVHSTPITYEVFRTYYRVISRAMCQMMADGTIGMGDRIILPALEDVAKEMGRWDGPGGVENGLLAEIERRTNVYAPEGHGGWQLVPFAVAVKQGTITQAERDRIFGSIVFFSLSSEAFPSDKAQMLTNAVAQTLNGHATFCDCTEYRSSLPISTPDASTGPSGTSSPTSSSGPSASMDSPPSPGIASSPPPLAGSRTARRRNTGIGT